MCFCFSSPRTRHVASLHFTAKRINPLNRSSATLNRADRRIEPFEPLRSSILNRATGALNTMNITIQGQPLPNMPWEERPAGCEAPLWRYSKNPVIRRDLLPTSNSIFNSAVVPFGTGFAGVFRCDDTNRRMTLHVGFSDDGLNWNINEETLKFECDNKEIGEWVYGYDPRVCRIDDRWWVLRTSRRSIKWRTLSCRTTATACSSHVKLTPSLQGRAGVGLAMLCSAAPATRGIRPLAISSTASHPTWSTGDIIAM